MHNDVRNEKGRMEQRRIDRVIKLANVLELGDPDVAGKSLADIALFLLKRIPEHKRPEAIRKMIIKIRNTFWKTI